MVVDVNDGPQESEADAQAPLDFREEAVDELDEPTLTPPRIVIRFFIIPLGLVIAVLGLYGLLGWLLGGGERSVTDMVHDLRSPFQATREHALYDLTRYLKEHPEAAGEEALFHAFVAAFKDRDEFQPSARTYLAMGLGLSGRREAVDILLAGLKDDDPNFRFYIIWALGKLGHKEVAPQLVPFLDSADAGLREITVIVLGMLDARAYSDAIANRLGDSNPSVRLNAAMTLGRFGDERALPTFVKLLDREYLNELLKEDPQAKNKAEDVLLNIITIAPHYPQADGLWAAITHLAQSDPSLKVRDAAMKALAERAK